jgi:hypothetical protein
MNAKLHSRKTAFSGFLAKGGRQRCAMHRVLRGTALAGGSSQRFLDASPYEEGGPSERTIERAVLRLCSFAFMQLSSCS